MVEAKVIRGRATAWLQENSADESTLLLFLHGCPDSPEIWQPQLDYFHAQGYTVLAPYARGIGGSAPAQDRQRYGLDAIALDHLEILRSVDPDGHRKVIVVGHDIGGIHAWKLARLLGSRLAALVLLNAPDLSQMARRLSQPRQLLKSWYIALFQLPLLPEAWLARWEPLLIARAQKKTGMPTDTPVSITPFLNQYREAARAIPEVLKQNDTPVTCPVLVVWSKDDAFLEVPSMAELGRLATAVTVRVIEGNHWVHHHEAARVNALVNRFFKEKL